MFEFPAASVNEPFMIPTMYVPLPDGIRVAVYTVLEVAEKLLKAPPPERVISSIAKSVVASDEVKVKVSEASLVESPSLTGLPLLLAAVMVMVGAVLSSGGAETLSQSWIVNAPELSL